MKISLDWFKKKNLKELESLIVEEQRLKVELLKSQLPEGTYTETKPPYMSVKLINDVLVVVLHDGTVLSKAGADKDDYNKIKLSKTFNDIMKVVEVPEVLIEKEKIEKELAKSIFISNGINQLNQFSDFEVIDNIVYLVGTDRSIPEILVNKFIEVISKYNEYEVQQIDTELLPKDEEYQALKRFFLWCCLNPRAEVANELYEFLMKNSFRITKQGFFVALRNVVTVKNHSSNTALVEFVSNAYNKVRAVWKKHPAHFNVIKEDGEFKISTSEIRGTIIGNLKDLYDNMPEMEGNRYTDNYTRTFDIRVGKLVNMPPEDCNWSTADCAEAGLHFTSDQIHYVGCGDTSVLILINPMKVVGIGERKGRCYEYLPIMTVPRDEATEILHDLDFDTMQLDEDYAINELDALAERCKAGFQAETTKHQFNLPNISTMNINRIVLSLSEMKDTISKRVSVIK